MQKSQSRHEDWIVAVVCMIAVLMLSFFYNDNKAVPEKNTASVEHKADRSPASLESVNPEE